MRMTTAALTGILLLNTAGVALAQATHGLTKHDASIAQYDYNLPIQTSESVATGSLKDDLDGGAVPTGRTSSLSSAPTRQPVMVPQPAPRESSINLDQVMQTPAANFTLPSVQGPTVSLNDSLAKGPTLLLFVRGVSSPYSLQQLQLMQKNQQQFASLGIQVLAVSSDPMSTLQAAQSRYHFSFPIVSDPASAIARRYGILEVTQPTPALFSIDRQGKILGVQLETARKNVFDLNQASMPLRQNVTQPAIAKPETVSIQDPAAGMPAVVHMPSDPLLDQPTEMLSDSNDAENVMPAVPSPRSTMAAPVPDNVPKIKYTVPPSSPDFVDGIKPINTVSI